MRFRVVVLALLGVCAIFATPVAAQGRDNRWFLNAGVGPSFGTFGSTPVVGASTGYKLTDRFSLVGEFGVLPHASFDKATGVPTVPPVIASRDELYVNNYHVNANVRVQPVTRGRFSPYVTGGFGSFTRLHDSERHSRGHPHFRLRGYDQARRRTSVRASPIG